MSSNSPHEEWLVTDGSGSFAMGAGAGYRSRKYHGFFCRIAGRGEKSVLADLDIRINGEPLWPHLYARDTEVSDLVVDPPAEASGRKFKFTRSEQTGLPGWEWEFAPTTPGRAPSKLAFRLEREELSGFRLVWDWDGDEPAQLSVRLFFALRPLHSLGGSDWGLKAEERDIHGWTGVTVYRVFAGDEGSGPAELFLCAEGDWYWNENPQWYYRFKYPEEGTRGYPTTEDLFTQGEFRISLPSGRQLPKKCSLRLVQRRAGFEALTTQVVAPAPDRTGASVRASILDFVLNRPAGIVAGFPWFGEWGRDTFVSLPGITAGWLESASDPATVCAWSEEVLDRWGQWIHAVGMLPNVLEGNGTQQWESADATLWWCHAAASLWAMSLSEDDSVKSPVFHRIEERFSQTLNSAITSIRSGNHRYLRENAEGLLEVTAPHATWMDARVDGRPVTPRMGLLPEINALWFQALCLQGIWANGTVPPELAVGGLGLRVLQLAETEMERPNSIFMHSLPLAPFFVLSQLSATATATSMVAAADFARIRKNFWTPVGLRSLLPSHPDYRPCCAGDQRSRDLSYHQGTVWGWLGGHFEMAKDRQGVDMAEESTFSEQTLAGMPILGHIPEIFDGDAPFAPRGAPAQAWSLACHLESRARRRQGVDRLLARLFAASSLGGGK